MGKLIPLDQARQRGLIGHVEADREQAGHEAHDVQERQPEPQPERTEANTSARPRSAATSTVRNRQRSTSTPTTSENSRIGTCCTARSTPSCAAAAPSEVTATSGRVT
ncbi:hypothetical protein [Kribbella sp. NPDC000426]|uniref:hypothetical protein n=1 Tax=Kribbella sp. NPDC000426 TaxID=3154255 RepID=UPI0033227362